MGSNLRNAVARPGRFTCNQVIMPDGQSFPERLHMQEKSLRRALAISGKGALVGKELLSPEGSSRHRVSLFHAPYVQDIRPYAVQGFAYPPNR